MQFDHFQLRLAQLQDADGFYQLVENNRPRLEDFFPGTVARTRTLQDTRDYFAKIEKKIEDRSYFPFLIIDIKEQLFIGFLDIKNIDWKIPKAEIGYFIDAHYEGKGITGKALSMLTESGAKELGIRKFLIRTHTGNRSSKALAEKCGFQIEGIIRSDHKTSKGELVDLAYYGLVIPEKTDL